MAKINSRTLVSWADLPGDARLYVSKEDESSGEKDRNVTKAEIEAGVLAAASIAKGNQTNVDPGATDDDSEGYAPGSRWVNLATGEEFVCVDATTGAAVWRSTTGPSTGTYDFLLGFTAQPAASALDWVLVGRSVTIASADPGEAYARTNPAAAASFDIQKNGASVGSVAIATNGTVTWTVAADIVLAAGDRLELVAPGTQDSALADVQVLLKGTN